MPAKEHYSFFIYVIYDFTSEINLSVRGEGEEGAVCKAECETGQNFHV